MREISPEGARTCPDYRRIYSGAIWTISSKQGGIRGSYNGLEQGENGCMTELIPAKSRDFEKIWRFPLRIE
jgi:hypothetical protein